MASDEHAEQSERLLADGSWYALGGSSSLVVTAAPPRLDDDPMRLRGRRSAELQAARGEQPLDRRRGPARTSSASSATTIAPASTPSSP